MPPKRRTSAAPPASKCTRSSNATAINNAHSAPDIVVSTASRDQLLLLSTQEFCLQSLAYSLPSSGNIHTSNYVLNNSHCATTAASLLQPMDGNLSHMDRSIFDLQQFACQLSDLLCPLILEALEEDIWYEY